MVFSRIVGTGSITNYENVKPSSRQRRADMEGADGSIEREGAATMSDSSIDYLNDPLLLTPDERPKAERTPLIERAAEVLDRINAFVAETGREPVSARGRDVRERMLANELAGLRASRGDLAGLAPADTRGLVFGDAQGDPMDDPLLADAGGIFELRDALKPKAQPDYVADRRPCPDFERFRPAFESVRRNVEEGVRKPQPFHQERVELGEFFILT